MDWQPIETAPNDVAILIVRDDGSVEYISAGENRYKWRKHPGKRDWCVTPTHWMPLPEPPKGGGDA